MMQWGNWGNYGWGMGFGWLSMIIFWAMVIIVAVYLVKAVSNNAGRGTRHKAPLEILKRRYAKGEITKEEFERMKDDLMKQ